MPDGNDAAGLVELIEHALEIADQRGETLVAALLAECLASLEERNRCRPNRTET